MLFIGEILLTLLISSDFSCGSENTLQQNNFARAASAGKQDHQDVAWTGSDQEFDRIQEYRLIKESRRLIVRSNQFPEE